jgi:hypothetical protein
MFATTGLLEDDGRRAVVSKVRANRLPVRNHWKALPHKTIVVTGVEEVRGVWALIVA